jgi:HAD superfamily hydrolase (TIGR01459 family)
MPSSDTCHPQRPRTIGGLRALAPAYDGFILDLWGCLHDGFKPFPGVIDALERLIAAGKRICILSNAPRRAADVIQRMSEIGIPPGLYHHAMSSGEETWQHLAQRPDEFYRALGRACFHIGPRRDDGMLEDVGLRPVTENTGPWGWEERATHYEAVMQAARARDLPMICANPDLVVQHGGRVAICAGTLAQRYEALGGRVRWHGKPFAAVYETCFALLEIADRRRILAVGDSLRTDIAGANGVGIDSLLVAGGIHAEEFGLAPGGQPDAALIDAVLARDPFDESSGGAPDYVISHFAW